MGTLPLMYDLHCEKPPALPLLEQDVMVTLPDFRVEQEVEPASAGSASNGHANNASNAAHEINAIIFI